MNLQQLRIVREAVQQNFNLTEVAAALFTSQSGVSKHIKDLEDELGVVVVGAFLDHGWGPRSGQKTGFEGVRAPRV